MRIWIDADAAPRPVKDIVYRASARTHVAVVVVANSFQRTPKSAYVSFVQVGKGFDVADEYIADGVESGDLVVTSDIPLAAAVVDKGAHVLEFRGEELSADNVRQRLSVRDFLDEMRGAGVEVGGGPPPFHNRDKERFANALDRWLTRALRRAAATRPPST